MKGEKEEIDKETLRKKLESIKDEIEVKEDKEVKDITYYKDTEVVGIKMDLYYAMSQDENGKVSYTLYNGKEKIGEGNKTGKQIKLDKEYLKEIEERMHQIDPEYSLDEYGGYQAKLQQKDLEANKVASLSELEKEKQQKQGVILPGLEEEDEQQKEEKQKTKIEKDLKLTQIQRISGRDACAVLGSDTQNYQDLYVGYSAEAQAFVPIGMNGNDMKVIEGVKSYRAIAGGEQGKETYYMSAEDDPYRGGIRIEKANNGDLDVIVERRSEKDPNVIEHTHINDNGHTIDKEHEVEEDNGQVVDTEEKRKQEEEKKKKEDRDKEITSLEERKSKEEEEEDMERGYPGSRRYY